MDETRAAEIETTFKRIARPLRWPMEDYARSKVTNRGFVGYRFFRKRRRSVAGFAFGFALTPDVLPGVTETPEVVAYAFVEPQGSALHRTLTRPARGAVRRLVTSSRGMGYPFQFHSDGPVVAVRHRSVRRVPKEIFVLVASDFLMLCYQPLRASGYLDRVRKATIKPE